MLPLAGLVMAIFVGYVIDKSKVEAVLKKPLGFAFELWYFSLRYIVPVALFVVALSLMGVVTI
jgi:NSS family neurotransmitter:Na+ symporter